MIRQCAAYAIRYSERYGIWGGLSERERAALALQLDRALAIIGTAGAALSKGGRGLP